jgi:hypothetical protein
MTINRSILEYVDNLNNEGNSIQDEDEQWKLKLNYLYIM